MSVNYLLAIVLTLAVGGPFIAIGLVWIAAKVRPDAYSSPFGDHPRITTERDYDAS